jgi:hypothetical protein
MTRPQHTKLSATISVVILLLILVDSTMFACTSFAVYGKNKIYGMNFDYANVELRFSIIRYNDRKIFQAFFAILAECDSLQGGYDYLDSTGVRVVHIFGSTLHDFFADKYNKACVLEVGTDKNFITKMKNNIMVMTNFPNYLYADSPLDAISGVGAERYKSAYQYIEANRDDFTYDNGIETLHRTVQSTGDFPTQCSIVFEPEKNELFIVLKRDFTKVWKVSVDSETIETYIGFGGQTKIALDSTGILASELAAISSVPAGADALPHGFALYQNYPNPFNPTTVISYQLAVNSFVTVRMYDELGKEIARLVNREKSAGRHSVRWDGASFPSGVYMVELTAGNYHDVKKTLVIK